MVLGKNAETVFFWPKVLDPSVLKGRPLLPSNGNELSQIKG
jgi:hypothetical protein